MNRTLKKPPFLIAAGGLLIILSAPSSCLPAALVIDTAAKFQTIEGFGGGFVFGTYPHGRPCKDELYDSLFNRAGINVVRINNTYDPEKNNAVDEIPMLREIRQKWPHVKVILASWSPPASLKSNGSKAGAKGGDTGTIVKKDGVFSYDAYADYWLKSARHFQDSGASVDWISIQNEPNFAPPYDGCVLLPIESDRYASYGKALGAVYAKIATLPVPIPLIGPDLLGISDSLLQKYIASPDMHAEQLAAICHHFYTGADSISMHSLARSFPTTPLFQTEYLINEDATGQAWFDHAQLIQRALTVEGVSMYDVFALTYRQHSTHCLFSLDSAGGGGFATRPMYFAFKHFSKSIRRGWRRVGALLDAPGITVSAFASPSGDSIASVIVNGTTAAVAFSLSLPASGDRQVAVFQTNAAGPKKYAFEGTLSGSGPITVEPRSIVTLETPRQAAGVRPAVNRPASHPSPRFIIAVTVRTGELYLSPRDHARFPCRMSVFDPSGRKTGSVSLPKGKGRGAAGFILKGSFASGVCFLRLE